jgi:hypothetical protein
MRSTNGSAASRRSSATTPKRRTGYRLRVHIGTEGEHLRDAIRAGHARLVTLVPMSAKGMPPDWAIPVSDDEAVVATAPIAVGDVDAEPRGIAALVVRRDALPRPQIDDAHRDRLVAALVAILCNGVTR